MLTNHKENCLNINGLQSVRLEKRTNEFKNYLKLVPAPFKIFVDFESNLESVKIYEGSHSKKYQYHVLTFFAVLLTKLFVLMIDLVGQLLF